MQAPSTIYQALSIARNDLRDSDSASLDAQVLLCEVLGIPRASVLAHPEYELTAAQAQQYGALLERRAQGEPVAYILGRRAFYDRDLIVTPDVLIPRPETELLLEEALSFANRHPVTNAMDVGTGSGALAVTFAAHCPSTTVYATDISPAALTVARKNANAAAVDIEFIIGNLLQPLIDSRIQVDLVMANLPYIRSNELPELAVSQHEPALALDGGDDGLELVRELVLQLPQVCNPGALVLLEIGAGQGREVAAFVQQKIAPQSLNILPDYAGHDRIVKVVTG